MNNNEKFSFYLKYLNIEVNETVLQLTSQYYYCLDEILHIKTVVHYKELNRVDNLIKLISNVTKGISKGTQFIGCFVDNKFRYTGRVGHWLLQLSEPNNKNYITRKKIMKLFSKYELEIIDMTEMNGFTYFCVKK